MSLDAWKAKAVTDVTLPSGTVVGIALPDTSECIAAGDIPMPIIEALAEHETNPDAEPLTGEELAASLKYRRVMICAAVRTVDGEEVRLTEDDLAGLPNADKLEIHAYATRSKPLPNQAQ